MFERHKPKDGTTLNLETQTDGRAVFFRSLLEQLEDGFLKPLRSTTEKAQQAVIDSGGTCSVSYIRSLRMELSRAGYVETRKQGKAWMIGATLKGQDAWFTAKDKVWGQSVERRRESLNPEMLNDLLTSVVRLCPNDEKAKRIKVFELWRSDEVKLYVVPSNARVARLKSDPHRYIVQLSDDEDSE